MSPRRSVRRRGQGLLLGLVIGTASVLPGGWVQGATAADALATFGTPTATSSFGTGVTFSQPVVLSADAGRAELLVTFGQAIGPIVIELPFPPGTGNQTLRYTLDPAADGHIAPNTPVAARWRLIGAGPTDVIIGPEVRITYLDDRFTWQTASGDLVSVHWYEGTPAFGRRALQIAEDAVREVSDLLRVTETDRVDFYVYADVEPFYDALGPGTRENVGGQANSEIRTLFALVSPSEINDPWVATVIPHELAHLVFDSAASNPYHFPPRWLNEGQAVFLSQGHDASDRAAVEGAAEAGTLIPLDGLTGQFPTGFLRFSLAYAESVSAVDYLVRTYGEEALVSLIRSYADGRTDDEAFTDALGVDMSAFGAAWLDDLGAAAPTRFGPQPAPKGPVPNAWLVDPEAPAPPAATIAPAASAPGGGASPSSAPVAPTARNEDGESSGSVLLFVMAAGVLALVVVVIVRRRRVDPDGPG